MRIPLYIIRLSEGVGVGISLGGVLLRDRRRKEGLLVGGGVGRLFARLWDDVMDGAIVFLLLQQFSLQCNYREAKE